MLSETYLVIYINPKSVNYATILVIFAIKEELHNRFNLISEKKSKNFQT